MLKFELKLVSKNQRSALLHLIQDLQMELWRLRGRGRGQPLPGGGRPGRRGRVLGGVPLLVRGEVVRPREGPLAAVALEGLVARVLPHVPRQLVRPREAPLAQPPRAPAMSCVRLTSTRGMTISFSFRDLPYVRAPFILISAAISYSGQSIKLPTVL